MKFKTQFNNKAHVNRKPEINTEPSMTVPDQAMSVMEIQRRFTRGMPIAAGMRDGIFDGDVEVPDLAKMDLAEREAFVRNAKDELSIIRQRMQADKEATIKKAKDIEELQRDVEKLKKGSTVDSKFRDDQQGTNDPALK